MKLTIEQSADAAEVEITVKCSVIDRKLEKLIEQIRMYSFSVTGKREGRSYPLALADIYYFESVDNRTFAYLEQDVYEVAPKLYELEAQMSAAGFVRVSKSAILNANMLESVRALLNGRMEAQMENGEKVIVSRHYVDALRAKIDLMRGGESSEEV